MSIEEQIWDYIDGNLDSGQKAAIGHKIATDATYQSVYQELFAVHQQMETIELEEPSMSFTRNVMEQVKLEIQPVSLKTKIDHKIILGIASFFILALVSVLVYAVSNVQFTVAKWTLPTLNIEPFITPFSIRIFLFIDLLIGLICIDSIFRKKRA